MQQTGKCEYCGRNSELVPKRVISVPKTLYEEKHLVEEAGQYCRDCFGKAKVFVGNGESKGAEISEDLNTLSKRNFGRYVKPELENKIAPKKFETATRQGYETWSRPVILTVREKIIKK